MLSVSVICAFSDFHQSSVCLAVTIISSELHRRYDFSGTDSFVCCNNGISFFVTSVTD